MIQVSASSFVPFLAAFSIANGAGATPLPVGGNEFLLADDTAPAVVDEIAAVPEVTVTDRPVAEPAGDGPRSTAKKPRTGSKE